MSVTRRRALQSLLSVPAVSSLHAQTPLGDLTNVFEMRDVARQKLGDDVYAMVSGTDRKALERITFRPRMLVNVTKLDLTLKLLGEELFAPIIVGPVSYQQAFHPEGELAMARGASAARTLMIVSSRSSRKLPEIVAEAKMPLWFQVYPDRDIDVTIAAARHAVQAGCKAVCMTVGVPYQTSDPAARPLKFQAGNLRMDWDMIGRFRQSIKAPLLLKGIMDPEEARLALSRGVEGIIVSNHGGMYMSGFTDPTEMLPSILDAVGGKIPVLIDGGFRRGTDILKALALGARAVLLGRPPVWGLAAYGADGVQRLLEMLQSELARNMAHCGAPDLKSLDRTFIRIDKR